jgi:hypothetical protein
VSVYDRRVLVLMLSSNFIILPLREVSVKLGEGHTSCRIRTKRSLKLPMLDA